MALIQQSGTDHTRSQLRHAAPLLIRSSLDSAIADTITAEFLAFFWPLLPNLRLLWRTRSTETAS